MVVQTGVCRLLVLRIFVISNSSFEHTLLNIWWDNNLNILASKSIRKITVAVVTCVILLKTRTRTLSKKTKSKINHNEPSRKMLKLSLPINFRIDRSHIMDAATNASHRCGRWKEEKPGVAYRGMNQADDSTAKAADEANSQNFDIQ